MESLKLLCKGFIVGLGKIIPGVSGGMLAITLNVYEPGIKAISHFFSNWKKNLFFLGLLGIGAIAAIVSASGIIERALTYYYLPTMLLFIGLMLGGFSSLKKEVENTNWKNYFVYLLLPFVIMIVLETTNGNSNFIFDGSIKSYFWIFLFGMIDAVTMIVPGVSGTAILMLLGCYSMLLDTFNHLFDFSMLATTCKIMIPFSLGILVGAMITIKIVSYLLEKHAIVFHYIIISFFLSSILLLLLQTLKQNYSILNIILGICCFVIGYFLSRKLEAHYN